MEQCYIMFGVQYGLRGESKVAASLLRAYFGSIRFSEAIYTEPIGLPDSGLFLNQVAVAGTNASLEEDEAGCEGDGKTIGTHVGQ